MKLEWTQVERWPRWLWWSTLLSGLWLTLGGVILLLGTFGTRPVPLCLFKRLTGCPCPTCGFTRGVLSLLQGHPLQGWLYNPLLFSFLGTFGAALGIRVLFGRTLHVRWTRRERIALCLAALLLVLANWLYVIRYVG
jgi:hypothetical protein